MTIRSVPILLVAAAAGLSACGGDGGDAPAGDGQAAREAAQIKFSRCMREHGVDLPDLPERGDGPRIARLGEDVDPETFRAAAEACEKYRRAAMPQLSEARQQEFQDQFLKFAACMRKEGVELPDPDFDGGGVRVGPEAGERPDIDDPKFRAAQKACEDEMPGRGGVRFEAGGGN